LPVGATRALPVDFRLVCATHRDLAALEREGSFRADLFARIAGYVLRVPPLRERREDLGIILRELLRRATPQREPFSLSPQFAQRLLEHDWKLNTRELEQVLGVAVVLSGGAMRLEHLHLPRPAPASLPEVEVPGSLLSDRDQAVRRELVALLRQHRGNISAVARQLGKHRIQIRRWMKRLHVRRYELH
jgi:sigma-54 dependent transcriptional regulator, acetoin dehydrogenase operon transcriptional activator AcoR